MMDYPINNPISPAFDIEDCYNITTNSSTNETTPLLDKPPKQQSKFCYLLEPIGLSLISLAYFIIIVQPSYINQLSIIIPNIVGCLGIFGYNISQSVTYRNLSLLCFSALWLTNSLIAFYIYQF